jgi:hypothetical protein
MTYTIGRITQLTNPPLGYRSQFDPKTGATIVSVEAANFSSQPSEPDGGKPASFVTLEEHQSVLDRLQTLEREICTLKDQMKVCESAASLIKNRG